MRMRLMISTLILASSMGATAMAQDATTFTSKPHLSKEEWLHLTPEQRAEKRAARHAKWESMTPEQRAEAKARHKAKWDAMTPEQQAKIKAERKERFESLPPAEQAKIKAERKAWHASHSDAGKENRIQLSPSEEKSQRGHLRRGQGISRPAGVDAVDTQQ